MTDELGEFGDTNWNSRTIVEIPAPVKSHGWFFHAHTGLERYVRLVFRVGRNAFKEAELAESLAPDRPLLVAEGPADEDSARDRVSLDKMTAAERTNAIIA